jgi:hypothetical protein
LVCPWACADFAEKFGGNQAGFEDGAGRDIYRSGEAMYYAFRLEWRTNPSPRSISERNSEALRDFIAKLELR